MKNYTKIALIFLIIGCFSFLCEYFMILTIQRSEAEFLDSSIWYLIWFGIFFLIFDIVYIIPISKNEKVVSKNNSYCFRKIFFSQTCKCQVFLAVFAF